jgi:predicted N-formylglutamate amidohydrolase
MGLRLDEANSAPLLGPGDPPAVGIENPFGRSPILLIADHAGNAVPASLSRLGLEQEELDRHIGIDIGILGVCRALSRRIDATLIHQRYSRLVIDCNRPPHVEDAFAPWSDGTEVPGNRALSLPDAARRIVEIFMPYHAAIGSWLDRRAIAGEQAAIVAMHSFTPVHGQLPGPRPWPVAVLFGRDRLIADRLFAALSGQVPGPIGVNQPYMVEDSGDFAIPIHGEKRGVPSVELEIRQDGIADAAGQELWAERLAGPLVEAVEAVLRSAETPRLRAV